MKNNKLFSQLKQAILQQAIQGELTADWRSKNPDIEPASELLKRIKAEKQKLIDGRKIRKEKPLPPITEEEIPFALPDGWVWCRLIDLSNNIHYGATKSAKPEKKEVRLLRITDIQNNMVDWKKVPGCDYSKKDIVNYKLSENDILIARTGGTIGKSFLVKNISVQSIFASYLIRVVPNNKINALYLKLFIESSGYWKQLFEAAWGAGQPNVNGTKLKGLLIPFPPHPEQKAIVQKVESLMQKCDAIENGKSIQSYKSIDTKADRLLVRYEYGNKILLELPKQQKQLKQLKQAILQEAIQGKLTADWRAENPDIEPTSELLKRMKAEKKKLIAEKKNRKEKPLPPISEDEIPFELPAGWVWCRVGQLGVVNRGKSPKYDKDGKNLILNQKCIRWFHVETQHCKTISLDWSKTLPDEVKTAVNDILVNSTGEGTIGRSAIVDEKSAGLLFDSHVLRVRTYIEPTYIITLINSDFGQNQINDLKGAKSTKQTELGVNNLSNMIFPLAPILEQNILIQKVETLMKKCTDLEAEIKQSETHAQQLMQAVIKEAFEDESNKIPVSQTVKEER